MTEKITNTGQENTENTFRKLSIQVGLNGLSFCALDTVSNKILVHEKINFKLVSTPYLMLKELKNILNEHKESLKEFSEVVVIHRNKLFSLVPLPLFNKDELPNYLKFNAKIMANDQIAFDEIPNQDLVNVYVPFTNINNYLFDLFGEFEYKHSGTVLISMLLNQVKVATEPVCYIQVSEKEMEVVIISDKKLLLYNQFDYKSKEDFLYFLLFTLEQLKLDTEKVQLKLFGNIEEDDPLFELCSTYVSNISVFAPNSTIFPFDEMEQQSIDFTVLSSL